MHYPEWDEDYPIHLARHSTGAQVVRVLQQMLIHKVGVDSFLCFSPFLLILKSFIYSFFICCGFRNFYNLVFILYSGIQRV